MAPINPSKATSESSAEPFWKQLTPLVDLFKSLLLDPGYLFFCSCVLIVLEALVLGGIITYVPCELNYYEYPPILVSLILTYFEGTVKAIEHIIATAFNSQGFHLHPPPPLPYNTITSCTSPPSFYNVHFPPSRIYV